MEFNSGHQYDRSFPVLTQIWPLGRHVKTNENSLIFFAFTFQIAAGVPRGFSFNTLKESLLEIPGVLAVHDLHVWSLTVGTTAIAVHLVIGECCENEDN